MKLICTLGNCGEKYVNTRHNAGFIFADYLSEQVKENFRLEPKLKAYILKTKLQDENIIVVKPTTFMNLSGDALALVMNFYKIERKDILVVYDDLSLNLGYIRFREKGSDGGHNGIKSIIRALGGNNVFDRLKIGIGPQPDYLPSEKFVLADFSKDEQVILKEVAEKSYAAFHIWLTEGLIKAQSRYNGCVV